MFLDRLLTNTRATLKNPPDWLYEALTGSEGPSVSGERVSPSKALGLSAYYAALRAISEDIAKLPFPLYRRLPNGGKERHPNHPLYPLIHDAPNPECSAMTFWETMLGHAQGNGNGLAEIQRAKGGQPLAMWLLDPTAVRIYRDRDDGQIRYEIRYETHRPRTILWEHMFHLHGLGFDGLTGYSIAHQARESIGSAIAARKHGAALFSNASRPGGFVSYPNAIKDKKKWRKAWEEGFQGADKAHKTAVLDSGASYTAISVPNKDAQWIEAQNFSVEEIARWFRIPPPKLQHLVYGTYANVEQLDIEYVTYTLTSWMVRIAQEVWRKLLMPHEKQTLFAEHVVEGLLRGDIETRYKAHSIARQWGWRSANDVKRLENENPLPGEQGDIYLIPANMMDASKVNEKPAPEPTQVPIPDEEPSRAALGLALDAPELIRRTVDAHQPLIRDAYLRTLRLEYDRIQSALKRPQFGSWLKTFRSGHMGHVESSLKGPVTGLVQTLWRLLHEDMPTSCLAERAQKQLLDMADRYTRRASTRLWRSKADIDEYADVEVAAERPKLIELLTEVCCNANSESKCR